jgi:transcriptional regulator with XRE-family HTH domain
MEYDASAIGSVIRQQRKLRNMSQEVLSGLAGIARTHLTMIETGSKQANFETLWKIALALDMRPCKLVEEIEIYMLSNRDQKHG